MYIVHLLCMQYDVADLAQVRQETHSFRGLNESVAPPRFSSRELAVDGAHEIRPAAGIRVLCTWTLYRCWSSCPGAVTHAGLGSVPDTCPSPSFPFKRPGSRPANYIELRRNLARHWHSFGADEYRKRIRPILITRRRPPWPTLRGFGFLSAANTQVYIRDSNSNPLSAWASDLSF